LGEIQGSLEGAGGGLFGLRRGHILGVWSRSPPDQSQIRARGKIDLRDWTFCSMSRSSKGGQMWTKTACTDPDRP
jgi:hypothetical protein